MSDYVPDRTQQESPKHKDSFNLRINLFFFSTFLIFCVIIVRLAILQFVEGPTLKGEETSRDVKNVPIAPARGIIFDDKGVKLAYSIPTLSMYVTLKSNYSDLEGGKKRDNYPEVEKLAEDLAAAFKEYGDPNGEILTKEDILKALDLNYRLYSGYIPRRIKMDITDKEYAYFMEHKSEYQGITIVEENKRQYDPDTVAVQTIGYIKDFKRSKTLDKYQTITDLMKDGTQKDPGLIYNESEFVGFDGLELMYQDELRGKNGYMEIPVDPRNMPEGVDNIIPPEKGHDVWSTINKDVQMKTEQAIMDQLDWLHKNPVSGKLHRDATTGFAVAMEVKTGKVVAMASMPDYDTNVWGSGAVSSDNWKNIEYTYQNGTIRSFNSGKKGYHPESVVLLGSTIKPLSVLIGLKEGFFSKNYTYYDKGAAYFGKEGHQARIQNSGGHVYGPLSPAGALEHSSNAFMVDKVGMPLHSKYGSEAIGIWDRYMMDFGLGVVTGSGLPGEQRGIREYILNENESTQSRMAYASFGQQGKYTTLQLAQYTATLANEGKRMKPQIVSKITDKAGNVVQQFQPEVLNVVNFDKSYWNVVKKGMNSKVSAFGDFPYDFARKTGTSTQQVGRELVDNGVFIAYAPRENPVLAVAVMIPEGGFGSNSAAPIARKIFDAYDEVYGLDGIPKGNKKTSTDKPIE